MAGSAPQQSVTCPACGRRYRFRPQYAGRQVRCLCEAIIEYPALPAPEPTPTTDATPADAPSTAELYELDLPAPPAPIALTPKPAPPPPPPVHVEPASVDEDDEDDALTLRDHLVMFLGRFAPGLFSPLVIILSGLCTLLAAAAMGFGGWAVREGEVQGSVIFIAIATVVHAQGMVWIVVGRVELISESITQMDGLWTSFFVLTVIPILMGVGAIYGFEIIMQ